MSYYQQNNLQTISMINREAMRIFKNSNAFLQQMDMQWEELFNKPIGPNLRIRLTETIGLQEACIVGTVAVLLKNPVMSRRFWDI